jgi:hypothetical protein
MLKHHRVEKADEKRVLASMFDYVFCEEAKRGFIGCSLLEYRQKWLLSPG